MARICIVEDDPHIARMIEATLSIGGYESRICGDGLQAVEEILKGHYDMVLLDVMLPGMDGFEIIGHIRTKEIPVIFLTAKQEVSDKVKGLRLGAEDYIVKPFEAGTAGAGGGGAAPDKPRPQCAAISGYRGKHRRAYR